MYPGVFPSFIVFHSMNDINKWIPNIHKKHYWFYFLLVHTLFIIFPKIWTKRLKRILKSFNSRYRREKKNKNKKSSREIITVRVSKVKSEKRAMLTNRSNFYFNSILMSTEEKVEMDFHATILTYFGYGTIFLASLVGNSFLIHIIRTDTSMKTAINYLILNQACVDLLIPFMHLMDNFRYSSYHGSWFGGNMGHITCKLYLASLCVLPSLSIFLLLAIAVDRFYAVFRPFNRTPISRNIKTVFLFMWTCSLVGPTTVLANRHLETKNHSYFCHSRILLRLGEGNKFYVMSLLLGIVIPLTLMATLYTRICIKLCSRQAPGEGASQNQRQLQIIATARKVTMMMIAIVVLFLICWVPFYISMALLYLGFGQNKAVLFSVWLTVSYSGINPYVYFAFSTKFRNGLKHLFGNIHVFPFRSVSMELHQI